MGKVRLENWAWLPSINRSTLTFLTQPANGHLAVFQWLNILTHAQTEPFSENRASPPPSPPSVRWGWREVFQLRRLLGSTEPALSPGGATARQLPPGKGGESDRSWLIARTRTSVDDQFGEFLEEQPPASSSFLYWSDGLQPRFAAPCRMSHRHVKH